MDDRELDRLLERTLDEDDVERTRRLADAGVLAWLEHRARPEPLPTGAGASRSLWKPLLLAAGLILAGTILWQLRQPTAPIDELDGLVEVERRGGWTALAAEMRLEPGDRIRTGSDGRLVTRAATARLRLDPDSELEIVRTGRGDGPELRLHAGQLLCQVDEAEDGFEVATPAGEVQVKGTEFQLRLRQIDDPGGYPGFAGLGRVLGRSASELRGATLHVTVLEGVVAIANPLGSLELSAGQEGRALAALTDAGETLAVLTTERVDPTVVVSTPPDPARPAADLAELTRQTARLQALLAELQTTQPRPRPGAPPARLIPRLTELQLLIALEQELHQQTSALYQAVEVSGTAGPKERAELARLAARQLQLRELAVHCQLSNDEATYRPPVDTLERLWTQLSELPDELRTARRQGAAQLLQLEAAHDHVAGLKRQQQRLAEAARRVRTGAQLAAFRRRLAELGADFANKIEALTLSATTDGERRAAHLLERARFQLELVSAEAGLATAQQAVEATSPALAEAVEALAAELVPARTRYRELQLACLEAVLAQVDTAPALRVVEQLLAQEGARVVAAEARRAAEALSAGRGAGPILEQLRTTLFDSDGQR